MGGIAVDEQKFLSSVKLLPWAQFVGAWLAVGGLLSAALFAGGFWHAVARIASVLGVGIGLTAFIFSAIHKPGLFSFRHLLSGVGLIVAAFTTALLAPHPLFLSISGF